MLKIFTFTLAIWGAALLVLLWWLSLPIVYVSNSTGQCDRVEYAEYDIDYDCTYIPPKHHRVIIK